MLFYTNECFCLCVVIDGDACLKVVGKGNCMVMSCDYWGR